MVRSLVSSEVELLPSINPQFRRQYQKESLIRSKRETNKGMPHAETIREHYLYVEDVIIKSTMFRK